ncbi:MAG: hypothetical protein OEU32_04990 [Acidimicrobiia bacterium]|nr:hypothetical protein [Acidimicrobiia bacterium]
MCIRAALGRVTPLLAIVVASATIAPIAVAGDGPTDRVQRIFVANSIVSGPADYDFVFGDPTGTTLTGDWEGNGRTGFGSRTGNVFTLADERGLGSVTVGFGTPGDEVFVGDWDGDGTDTLAVRRGNVFHLANRIAAGPADITLGYGKAGDEVFVGDWDGDGVDTFAVRRGNVFFVRSSVSSGPADVVFGYGRAGDEVLVGDWDSDGIDTFAVRRAKLIFIRDDFVSGPATTTIGYGRATDTLLVGDWDGDGVDTFAVTRSEAAGIDDDPCPLAPADSFWHADVADLALHSRSATFVATIGASAAVHADFGSGLWAGSPIGIPFTTVGAGQPRVPITFEFADESDPGPYPIPPDAPIEGGSDRHLLVVDEDACVLYEVFRAVADGNGGWDAGSGAVFDLRSNTLRPAGWTSADAAGLAILPGLVQYDEVAAGDIDHAIRMTVPRTRTSYVWPARHQAGESADTTLPPMGTWLRLRSDADLSGLGPQASVIAEAMQTHGVIIADNGSRWFISGTPDPRWDNDDLHTLGALEGSMFEVVDSGVMMVTPDSGQAS